MFSALCRTGCANAAKRRDARERPCLNKPGDGLERVVYSRPNPNARPARRAMQQLTTRPNLNHTPIVTSHISTPGY